MGGRDGREADEAVLEGEDHLSRGGRGERRGWRRGNMVNADTIFRHATVGSNFSQLTNSIPHVTFHQLILSPV